MEVATKHYCLRRSPKYPKPMQAVSEVSDFVDAQNNLSLRGAQTNLVGLLFVRC